jgi:hypothetical protein
MLGESIIEKSPKNQLKSNQDVLVPIIAIMRSQKAKKSRGLFFFQNQLIFFHDVFAHRVHRGRLGTGALRQAG